MNRCCPLSTTLPVSESIHERARPPRCGRASRRSVRAPFSARSVAAASPAKPPPTTMTSGFFPAPPGILRPDLAERPGAERHAELLEARDRDAALEHPELAAFDASQQPQIDGPHDLRSQETLPVGLGKEPGRALKVPVGTRRLPPHESQEGRRALPLEELRLAVTAGGDLVQRHVDSAAYGVRLEVAEDVRKLQGDAEVDGVVAAPYVAAPEDRQADETDGRGDAAAVDTQLVEVAVARLSQVHRDPVEEILERLPRNVVAADTGLKVAGHGEVGRAAVAAGNLLAIRVEIELRPRRVERSLVRQIVDDPAERVHGQNPAPLVLRQKAEGVMEGRSRGGARAARRRSGPDARCDVASRTRLGSHLPHTTALPRTTRASRAPSFGRCFRTSKRCVSMRSRIRCPPSQVNRSSQRKRPRTASHSDRPAASSSRVSATRSRIRERKLSLVRPATRSSSVTPKRRRASSGR